MSLTSTSASLMDAGPGLNPASLVVPSQRPSTSYPSNIFAGACTRCGRPTELGNGWNICGSCAAGGPRPGIAIATGPSTQIKQCPIANCTACRVPFRVASHRQAAHALCPSCQAIHGTVTKPNPRDCTAPRANPYPVVPPITKAPCPLALPLAFTYPNLPVPSPASGSVGGRVYTGVNHREDVLRGCVRFGCSARLPEHVSGDMCEACARAGFVRPPPAVVQKRVPRRATERTCARPRESLDLVHASLLREAARGAEVTTEGKDIENEFEVELVYPDEDMPVATRYTSTTESKFIENEDAELELVYPEVDSISSARDGNPSADSHSYQDAAKATRTSSPKLQTRLSPPTTLRELFKDGLHPIPTLQNLAAPVDRSPPRHCRMPGCNEALPAQTCIQRCAKCNVGRWKRHKLTAKDTLDPSRRPGTSSLTTDASVEVREVTNMLDEISDIKDGSGPAPPPPPPPSSSPSKDSSNELTRYYGVSSIPEWESDPTELTCPDSDTESMSDSGPEPDPRLTSPHGGITGLRIRIPLLVTRLPPGSLLRKCGNKRCNIALPKDHRWKTCDPCRVAQRTRFENKRRRMMAVEGLKSPDFSCRRWRSLIPYMGQTDETLVPETSRACSGRHCRNQIPLPEVYRWKTCASCRDNARREARRKRDVLFESQHLSCQPEIVPRFPAHQNRGALLSSFDAQLKGFVEGKVMYLRAKLHDSEDGGQVESELWKPEHIPMIFVFVGEYSVVTHQREGSSHDREYPRWPDKLAELEPMRREVLSIVLDLERVVRANFRAGEAFAIDKGGIIMRFTCSLQLIAQLHPLATTVGPGPGPGPSSASDSKANASKGEDAVMVKPPPSPPAVPLVKTFNVELEAVVVPDESHHLFRGRRTVVRFRMVG